MENGLVAVGGVGLIDGGLISSSRRRGIIDGEWISWSRRSGINRWRMD